MTSLTRRSALLVFATSSAILLAAHQAQGQTERYRYRHGGANYGVAFLDSDQGIVTRDGGGALYSTDGGDSWIEADVPTTVRKQLRNIFVVDDEVAWTVGSGGVVLETTSRGAAWTHVNDGYPVPNRNNQPASLYDIWMFPNGLDGICVGEEGTLASTANGGLTWAPITLPLDFYDTTSSDPIVNEPGDIYQVHFFDTDDGIISADNGRILRTDDGGATWETGFFSSYCGYDPAGDLELWSMSFDGDEGWLVGGNGFNNAHAFYSDNRGGGWAHIRYMVPVDSTVATELTTGSMNGGGWPTFYGVAALGEGDAIISGYAGRIYDYSASGSSSMDAIFRCAPLDPMAPTIQPALIHTTPLTYSGPGLDPGSVPLFSAFALSATERWIAGTFGGIKQWNNSTSTWVERGSGAQVRFWDADFVNATTGIVGAQGHRVLKTEDGGITFDQVYVGTSSSEAMTLVGLSKQTSSQLGLASGTSNLMLRTADQGDTWSAINGPGFAVTCLEFPGAGNVAFVGGSAGQVSRTDVGVLSSGQLTWVDVDLPDQDFNVTGLSFVDEDTGYAVTAGMKTWATSDSGANWTEVQILSAPSTTQALRAVSTFGSGAKAVAVGSAGLVLVRDGTRFQVVDLSATIGAAQLNAVAVLGGGTRIVVAGNDGLIAEWEGTTFADALNPSNWTTPKSLTDLHIAAISFDAVDHGFVVGQNALVLEYD
ncbi:MAG: hypothetical protein GC161_05160 [Planctomycetaceae bacterium]|nr:hypothetical protein [Planctomycetaceae bacterium]